MIYATCLWKALDILFLVIHHIPGNITWMGCDCDIKWTFQMAALAAIKLTTGAAEFK